MKIRETSDLHLEFYSPDEKLVLPTMPDDKDTVLILSGDIVLAKQVSIHEYFFVNCSDRFRDVIYIMGNHEYYGTHIGTGLEKCKDFLRQFENIHVLENEVVEIDDVAFVCATLWSDFDKKDPFTIWSAQNMMNDYKKIRCGPTSEPWKHKFSPITASNIFFHSKQFIFNNIEDYKDNGKKVVVVTHMGPSYQSVPDHFKGSSLNGAYVSELSEEIIDSSPDIWFHGHTHTSFDYFIGDTRIICNPYGYKHHEVNDDFNPELLIEV